MNILDSNVEALAFNYFNFGLLTLLNNLWTCLALLTAALSFWKIRSSGSPKSNSSDPVVVSLRPDELVTKPLASLTPETEAPTEKMTAVRNVCGEDVDGVRKGKFIVYYECGNGETSGKLEGWEMEKREGCDESEEWWKCWENVLRLRNGEIQKGWYTCQDLTELNGNVVKFWDGELSFGGSSCFTDESWYSSTCCMPIFRV